MNVSVGGKLKKLIIFIIITFFFITVYSIENDNLTNETSIITNITEFDLINETSVNITNITEFDLTENVFNETEEITTSEIKEDFIDLSLPQVKQAIDLSKIEPRIEYVPDEVLVKFKKEVLPEKIEGIIQEFKINKVSKIKELEVHRLKIPSGITVPEMVERLKKNPFVEFAEPNYYRYATMIPNDPYYQYQWHFDNPEYGGIHMEEAWDVTTGNPNVVVAVVDTGVAYEYYCESPSKCYYKAPDLSSTCFTSGYDFINNDAHPNDDNSHGTHVTGTIAQTTNNNLGVAGIAFNTCVMPVKVLDRKGSGTDVGVANGIIYATDNGAKIISMSLGGSSPSTTLENAINYAYNNGVSVIAACGNDNVANCDYPAAYGNAIAVGATQYDETKAPYSNYGSTLDLVAPGGNTAIDQNNDGYGDGVLQQTFNPTTKKTNDFAYYFFQGTSMATPHVSGVAALLLAINPSLTPDDIRDVLQSTAEDLGTAGRDNTYGYGLVNALAAVNAVPPPEIISITLSGYPINFGNLDYGTNNNPAQNNGNYIVTIDPETTVNVDLYQKGNNFVKDSDIIDINNMRWYNIDDVNSAFIMQLNYQTDNKISNIAPNTNVNMYYWLSIPSGQKAGNYLSTIYIKAVETGTLP